MKAIQYSGYGNSSVLQLNEVKIPGVKENEILIKISATTVNPLDMKLRSGQMQQIMPVRFPIRQEWMLQVRLKRQGARLLGLK